jgi:hypothetical protein
MSAPQSSLIKVLLSSFVQPNKRVTFSPNKPLHSNLSVYELVDKLINDGVEALEERITEEVEPVSFAFNGYIFNLILCFTLK